MNLRYGREIGLCRYLWRALLYKFQTRLLRREVEKILPTGTRLRLPRGHAHSAEIYGTNCRVDWGAEMLLAEYLGARSDRTTADFIDVGANIGFYSLLMSPQVRQVHAFEPDVRNLEPLRINAARVPNIRVIEKAAAAANGSCYLDVSGGQELNHLSPASASAPGLLLVETVTLDAYRSTLPPTVRVAAVKLDVEGYECDVLDGCDALTRLDRPVFLVEFSVGAPAVNTPTRLKSFLVAYDYVIYAVVRDGAFARTHRAALRRLEVADVSSVRTKMLFLAPRAEQFFAGRLGEQEVLRPA